MCEEELGSEPGVEATSPLKAMWAVADLSWLFGLEENTNWFTPLHYVIKMSR